jgi:putative transposase
MTEPELTDAMIEAAMLRAEKAGCPPDDQRCYGFPLGVKEALASRTSEGWCLIGFVVEVLVPSLRPGQIVIWDQLNVHKSTRARTLIEQAGCRVVFLPSYSPDFNPIEHAFAKAKQALRRLEARSWESIVAAIGQVLLTITTADARAFFADAGFPLPDTT